MSHLTIKLWEKASSVLSACMVIIVQLLWSTHLPWRAGSWRSLLHRGASLTVARWCLIADAFASRLSRHLRSIFNDPPQLYETLYDIDNYDFDDTTAIRQLHDPLLP